MNVKAGDKIKFIHPDGNIYDDVVIMGFDKDIILEPYAPNQKLPAVVLTKFSWIYTDDIVHNDGQ